MSARTLAALAALACRMTAQTVCPATPAFSLCELTLQVRADGASAEVRSPSHKTYLIAGFWDGAKTVLRISPTEAGTWDFRMNDGKEGHFTATASDVPGFVETANVHHFRNSGNRLAHLWMGDIAPSLDGPSFERYVDARAAQKFNHLRLTLQPKPGEPDPSYYRDVDTRVLYMNRKGIVADLVLAGGDNAFLRTFPERAAREKYIRYLVARYGAMNITWQGFENFETYDRGRELLKEIGGYLKSFDQYQHLRSTGALITSSPLFDDGWMNFLSYHTTDPQVPAIEHQIFAAPGVIDFRSAGDTEAFRKQLWNATMNGQYPQTGVPDDSAAKQMAVWRDFFANTRFWDLEPYFDVEGGRALALQDIEYIVYVEKPGPVTVQVEKHNYDLAWVNPITGEEVPLKNLKSETFTGEPPDRSHDWILHISREGQKAGMAKSYRFEARDILLQEVESAPAKVPFEIAQPSGDTLSLSKPPAYAVTLKKQTKATRAMQYMWTGEVTADAQSYRVLGTGANGVLQIPKDIAIRYPAALHLRVTGMNANGKVYYADRNYELNQ